ncbi:MAG: restriction endonuclease subunit M [Rhodopirellula sp.]|nr:restriction endonuclease subunit M [Rhodopirellula sp.]
MSSGKGAERGGAAKHQASGARAEWPVRRLGKLCVLVSGRHIEAKDYNTESRGVGYLTGPADFGELNPVVSKWTEHPQALAQGGDILITVKGAGVGKINLLDADNVAISRQLMAVRVKDADRRFVYAFLAWQFEYFQSRANGATVPGISREDVLGLRVPVPALAEQRRIVGILDEAFAGIATAKANAEKNLQNARELFESHLQAVFTQRGDGWVDRKVGDIAKKSLGKMLDKAKNQGTLRPYLRNLNVRWFDFDLSDLSQMRFLDEEAEKYTAVKGDVLICEGGYPGRAAIWDKEYPIHFQKAIHRVRFHQAEHNRWFVYYLSAKDASGELRRHFTGTGIQHFTGETLGRFEVPIPPLQQLRRLVSQFDKVAVETQRLASLYQRKLAALDELKKSLLHQAFTGQL